MLRDLLHFRIVVQLELLEKHLDIDALREILGEFEKMKAMTADMLAAYTAGDGDKMYAMVTDTTSWQAGKNEQEAKEGLEALLFDRNQNWIPGLEKLFADGTPFCAVGAGHLLGKRSVVDLLEQKGYKITRMTGK